MISKLYNFLEKRKTLWIFLLFAVFILYAIAKNTFLDVPWITEATGFNTTLNGVAVFSLVIALFALSYKLSFNLEKKKLLALLFGVMLILQIGVWSISSYRCTDAKGNYNLALLIADRGPVYYMSNYHTLQDVWSPELQSHIVDSFESLGIESWTDGLALNVDENLDADYVGGDYIRSAIHPPLLPLYYSLFIFAFGPSSFEAIQFAVAQWILVALIPIVMYLLLRKYFSKETSLKTAFIFMLVPVLLIYTATPVQETVMPLMFLLCTYLFLTAVEKKSNRLLVITGVLVSITSLIKFTGLVLFIPFLIVILWKFKTRFIPRAAYFLVSSAILPLILFLVFNYNILLNAALSKSVGYYAALHLFQAPALMIPAISVYYWTYLGIPLIILALFGVISALIFYYRGEEIEFFHHNNTGRVVKYKNLSLVNRFSIAAAITFVVSSVMLYGNFVKQMLPSFFLLSLPLAYCLKDTKNRRMYLYFFILIFQLLLFLFFL